VSFTKSRGISRSLARPRERCVGESGAPAEVQRRVAVEREERSQPWLGIGGLDELANTERIVCRNRALGLGASNWRIWRLTSKHAS
jgi:hypothetical protein